MGMTTNTKRKQMNDYEIKTMYDQVQKLEEELKMLKQEKGNCDCCKKED